jgi:hypothetical protein
MTQWPIGIYQTFCLRGADQKVKSWHSQTEKKTNKRMDISNSDATWQRFLYPARITTGKASHMVSALANPDPEPIIPAVLPAPD